MSSREKKKREADGASWMDTYGDMVTLLLTFFVMLFASSQINEEKWMRIVASFTGTPQGVYVEPIDPLNPTSALNASDYIPKTTTSNKTEDSKFDYQAQSRFNELYGKLSQYIQEKGLQTSVRLEQDGDYIYLTVIEGILFDSGSAEIRDARAEEVLTDIGLMIDASMESVRYLTIEGHADTNKIHTAQFKDNWDLSSIRANNVARFLSARCNIPGPKIISIGRGEWDPVASNDTPEGRQQNRRVKFILESLNAAPGANK